MVLVTLLALGCGAAREAAPPEATPAKAGFEVAADTSEAGGTAESGEPLPSQSGLERKIVYTARVDLVVEQFDPIPEQVETLVKQFDGFVASSSLTGSPGSSRSGQWTLRIPVARYEGFLAAARELGEMQQLNVDSQDVTEEYYDVEARIRNKKRTEERLLDLLEKATGKLDDILQVERELSRVREEIERVEGRLRVLKDLTSLTTVTLSVREIKHYVPEGAAGYTTRVRRGFNASIDALVATAQALSIAIVVLSPWLAVVLVFGLLLVVAWRLVRRRRKRSSLVEVERVEESPITG